MVFRKHILLLLRCALYTTDRNPCLTFPSSPHRTQSDAWRSQQDSSFLRNIVIDSAGHGFAPLTAFGNPSFFPSMPSMSFVKMWQRNQAFSPIFIRFASLLFKAKLDIISVYCKDVNSVQLIFHDNHTANQKDFDVCWTRSEKTDERSAGNVLHWWVYIVW